MRLVSQTNLLIGNDFRATLTTQEPKLKKGFSAVPTPFDFTQAMRSLCTDIAGRMPEFQHVRMSQIAVTFAQTRVTALHGLQAKLTPMRFENGSLVTRRGRRSFTVRRLFSGQDEILYILTFYLPRFHNQPLHEKLITVFHELYHISPRFDGDIRRLEGRYHVHSHSQQEYDEEMRVLAERYLAKRPPEKLWGFLRHDFRNLQARYGQVVGIKLPIPRLIPLPDVRTA